MTGFLAGVGAFTCFGLALFASWMVGHVVSNVIKALRGAYRLRRMLRPGRLKHRQAVRMALRCWLGVYGTYWRIDNIEVPADGTKPVEEFYGA